MTTEHPPFVISRTFNAPRSLVWKAWTEEHRMAKWFGPKGTTCTYVKFDLTPGGMSHYKMITADGNTMWGKAVYREIQPLDKLVWVTSFSDEHGGTTSHPMAPTWPKEMLTTVTFTEHQGQTTVTIRWEAINATPEEHKTFDTNHANMNGGWTGTFAQLEEYLKTT